MAGPLRPILVLLLCAGCSLHAATEVHKDSALDDSGEPAGDTGATVDGGDGGLAGDGAASDGAAEDGGALDPDDGDGDGWTAAEGDCDDADAAVHPEQADECDGTDSDCDGVVDEDARDHDPTEPNDDVPWSLGDLSSDPQLQTLASLTNDDDVDRFDFTFDDGGLSLFTLTVAVSNVPAGSSYRVRLEHLDRGEVVYDDSGSGTLAVEVSDTLLQDDGGTWELTVSSEHGADCGVDYLVSARLD